MHNIFRFASQFLLLTANLRAAGIPGWRGWQNGRIGWYIARTDLPVAERERFLEALMASDIMPRTAIVLLSVVGLSDPSSPVALITALRDTMGAQRVITSADACELLSGDLYSQGKPAAAVIRPSSAQMLANAVEQISAAGYALIPRGGGLSYTGGVCPESGASVVVDTADLQGVVNFDPGNMTVTVGAGTTWEAIYKYLSPYGLRLPYFGTFSGRRTGHQDGGYVPADRDAAACRVPVERLS